MGVGINNLCWGELSWDMGIATEPRECGNAAEGVSELDIPAGIGGLRFNLLVEKFKGSAQWDPAADMRAHTLFSCSYTIGSTNPLTTSFPALQIVGVSEVTKGTNTRAWQIQFAPRDMTRNDAIRISRAAS
jgi:hypothetical protein